jgi:drug/metabolite transporter (DMT)-like permease
MGDAIALAESSRKHYRAVGLALAASVLWSSGGLLIKWVAWNPLAISGARSAIATVVLLLALRRIRFSWSFAQVGGAVVYAATVILFVIATKLTTSANAILLQYTAPVYAALFGAWFLGERVSWLDWATIAVVIGGMILFFLDRLTPGGMLGNVFAITSGVTYAGLVTFLRKQKDASPLESVLMGNVLTALIGLPFMLQGAPGGASWTGLIFLGVFQLGLSYVLYSSAIKHITVLEAILVSVIEPILNPVWVYLVMGEAPGRWALMGGIVVLIGMAARYALSALRKT